MDPTALIALGKQSLFLALNLSLPVLGAALLMGLVVGLFQAATQIQDPGVSQLPRLLAVVLALYASGAFIADELIAFASRAFAGG